MARADMRPLFVVAAMVAVVPACKSTPERQCGTSPAPVTHLYDPHLPRDTVPVIDLKLCESLERACGRA